MQVAHESLVFSYQAGEEVVAVLDAAEAFDVERGVAVPAVCLPRWTIGAIAACMDRSRRPSYLLRFLHHGSPCVCIIDEAAIEGVA